jgi:hypothetical protein
MKNRRIHRFGISSYNNTIFPIRNWNLNLITGTNKSRTLNIIKRLKELESSEFPYPFTKKQIYDNKYKSNKIKKYHRWLRIFKNGMVYQDKANKNDYMSTKLEKEVRKEFREKTGLIIGKDGRLCRSQPGGFEQFIKSLVNTLKPEKRYIKSYVKIKQKSPTKKSFKDPNHNVIIKFKLNKKEKRQIIEQERLTHNKVIDPSNLNCKQRRTLKRMEQKKKV